MVLDEIADHSVGRGALCECAQAYVFMAILNISLRSAWDVTSIVYLLISVCPGQVESVLNMLLKGALSLVFFVNVLSVDTCRFECLLKTQLTCSTPALRIINVLRFKTFCRFECLSKSL